MTNKKEKVAIYIDGSNLYFKLKDLNIKNTLGFNYRGFCDFLARERAVVSYRYYVGVVRVKSNDLKTLALRKNQQRLFNNLEKQDFCIKRGYILGGKGKYHEKGVDVKIATDMLIGAYQDHYDVAILVSSDTDLIPAIKHINFLKKKVEYIGFFHQPSFGLQKDTIPRLLIRDDIDKFIGKTLV